MRELFVHALVSCYLWQSVAKQEGTACAVRSSSILQTRVVQTSYAGKSNRSDFIQGDQGVCSVMAYEGSGDDFDSRKGPCGPFSSTSWTDTCNGIDTIIVPEGCAIEVADDACGKGTRWGPFSANVAVRKTNPKIGFDKIRSMRVFAVDQTLSPGPNVCSDGTIIGIRRRNTISQRVQRRCCDEETGQCRDCSYTRRYSPQDYRRVKFEIRITNLWTSDRYPMDYPPDAKMGPIIAITGDGNFLASGKASPGLRKYAETGDLSEIQKDLLNAGTKVYEAKVINQIADPFTITAVRNYAASLNSGGKLVAGNDAPAIYGDTLEILARLNPSPDWYGYARISLINMVTNSIFIFRTETSHDNDLWWPHIGRSFDDFAEAFDAGANDGATYFANGSKNVTNIQPLRNSSNGSFSATDGRVLEINVKRVCLKCSPSSSYAEEGMDTAGESSSSYFTQERYDEEEEDKN